jgi:hypothetical protein
MIVVVCCGFYRVMSAVTPVSTPQLAVRAVPNVIEPRYDVPAIASDTQLAAVLDRVQPPTGPPNTNDLLHALRLWGPNAEFDDDDTPSGRTMRDYLVDDAVFQQLTGDAPPLVDSSDELQRIRSYRRGDPHRRNASVHTDDLLATFGEIGLPSGTVVRLRDGETTVAALVDAALRRYHRQQYEYEWSVITYARYAFPHPLWRNRHDETIEIDGLVDEVIAHPLRLGVCGGTHRLEALVVLLRADDAVGGLKPKTRAKIIAHLTEVSRLLVGSQHAEGYWTKSWPEGGESDSHTAPLLPERILATGHHLEWLALAPPEVLPPRETLVRAGQWLVRAMLEVDETSLRRDYGPFTHAARALCLWRSRDPYQAWRGDDVEIAGRDESQEHSHKNTASPNTASRITANQSAPAVGDRS